MGFFGNNITRILVIVGLVIGLCACPVSVRPPIEKDGELYGVTKGAFRHKWWNYYERGLSFMDGGFHAEAEADLRAALSRWDRDERRARTYGMHFIDYFPHRELGIALLQQGRVEAAIQELETSLSMVETAKAQFYLDKSRKEWIDQNRLDADPPQISIETPENDALTAEFTITVRGVASDDTFVKKITVNGRPVRIDLASPEKVFAADVPLRMGKNTIEIAATDLTGKRTRAIRRVRCDRTGPIMNVEHAVSPGLGGGTLQIKGYASDDSGIRSILVNGKTILERSVPEMDFDESVPLSPGQAEVVVTAVDSVENETRAVLDLSKVPMDVGVNRPDLDFNWLASLDVVPDASPVFSGLAGSDHPINRSGSAFGNLLASKIIYDSRDRSGKFSRLGNYYAFIIGINAYEEWRELKTAVNDAVALREVLIEQYGFDPENVFLLRDVEATQQRITDDLLGLLPELGERDNLLLYFAGHGELRKDAHEGYWIPVDGKIDSLLTWISHSSIKNLMASPEVRAKNIVVISDSCYGGFLTRGEESYIIRSLTDHEEKLLRLASKPSRQVITSGSLEPVADWGMDDHSLFAYHFLQALKTNDDPLVDIKTLIYSEVWPHVTGMGDQRPTMGRFDSTMDEGGEFILALDSERTEAPPPASPVMVSMGREDRSERPSRPAGDGRNPVASASAANDADPPELEVSHWKTHQTVQLERAFIDGRATDDVGVEVIEINGKNILKRPGKNVYFSQMVDLEEKDNVFVLKCRDQAGKETEQIITLHRKPQEIHQDDARMSMTVLPFQGRVESSPDLEKIILDYLFDSRRFNVKGGVVEPSGFDSAQAVASDLAAIGEQMGIDAVVSGEVVVNSSGIEVKVRIIDSENADVLTREDAFSEATGREAVRDLCEGLALKIKDALPLIEGIVVTARGEKVYVNIGMASRLKKNMELLVYKLGEPLIDPITEMVLEEGTVEVIARAKVSSVREKVSTALIKDKVVADAAIKPKYNVITR